MAAIVETYWPKQWMSTKRAEARDPHGRGSSKPGGETWGGVAKQRESPLSSQESHIQSWDTGRMGWIGATSNSPWLALNCQVGSSKELQEGGQFVRLHHALLRILNFIMWKSVPQTSLMINVTWLTLDKNLDAPDSLQKWWRTLGSD